MTKTLLGAGKNVTLNTLRIVIAGGCLPEFAFKRFELLLWDVRCVMFAWVLDRILLGDGFF